MIKNFFVSLLALALFAFAPFNQTALAADALPGNVIAVSPADIIGKIEQPDKPFTLFVFASWCPYCKQQMDLFNKLSPEQRAAVPPILAVSIDSQPDVFSRFMSTHSNLFFETRIYSGNASLETLLHNYGSGFDGGIPYIAIFKNQKIVKEFNGLVDPSEISLSQ